jgi:hypothetical protein
VFPLRDVSVAVLVELFELSVVRVRALLSVTALFELSVVELSDASIVELSVVEPSVKLLLLASILPLREESVELSVEVLPLSRVVVELSV